MNIDEINRMNATAWEIYGEEFSKMEEPVREVGSARDHVLYMVEKGYMAGYYNGLEISNKEKK